VKPPPHDIDDKARQSSAPMASADRMLLRFFPRAPPIAPKRGSIKQARTIPARKPRGPSNFAIPLVATTTLTGSDAGKAGIIAGRSGLVHVMFNCCGVKVLPLESKTLWQTTITLKDFSAVIGDVTVEA
jgi:hypothetical protein